MEAALAAATHRRDLAAEQARLSGEGVEQLERRIEALRREREREALAADRRHEGELREAERRYEGELREAERRHERELVEARERLEAREKHLANAQAGIEARDRRLEVANESLEARGRELEARTGELEERTGELEERTREVEALEVELTARRTEAATASARLELREEELERARAAAAEAGRELVALRERLAESERDLALRERELEARVRELGRVGDELIARERELGEASERLADSERELDAAGTLLETQGAELARSREAQSAAREALGEARKARSDAQDALAEERQAVGEAREAAQEAERERDAALVRLQARERHLENAKQGIEARDRRLEVAGERLEGAERTLRSRDAELERLRVAARNGDRRLALAEARLEKAQERAERFRGSLVELREGRSYRLMRVLWRLRRPFRRAPRKAEVEAGGGEDADPAPPVAREAPPVAREAPPVPREAPPRRPDAPLRVAAILDEMSEACFAPECDLVPLTLEGWREQLDERRPDLLLVESAWNANGGEWQYRIAEYPRKDLVGLPALRALLDGCRERGIPTAFWNKEDPVHFERFAEAAGLFDHVFTTDARCVERYRAIPGERTVAPLPFAAQPRIHNPIAAVPERSSSPCFAGAWYRDRHPDRRRALEQLLDAARPHGLVIYDRRFGADDDAFGFPDRFAPHVLGKLPYERILDVYKSHRVFLNANSVVDSPTMCSRRVFELAACDTAILSTPGAALAALLGEGTVEEAADEASAAAALERLLSDEDERRRRTRAARRAVFAEHTYADRLATIAAAAGLDVPDRDGEWELVVQSGVELSAEARADLRAASIFAPADAIGVGVANGAPAPEHRPVPALDPRALLVRREVLESRGAPAGSAEEVAAQLRRWNDEGIRLYAADADLL